MPKRKRICQTSHGRIAPAKGAMPPPDESSRAAKESSEADAVDGLGHRERVVRHNSAGSRCDRIASLGLLILEQEQQSKSTVAFAGILIQCAKLFHNALRIDCVAHI